MTFRVSFKRQATNSGARAHQGRCAEANTPIWVDCNFVARLNPMSQCPRGGARLGAACHIPVRAREAGPPSPFGSRLFARTSSSHPAAAAPRTAKSSAPCVRFQVEFFQEAPVAITRHGVGAATIDQVRTRLRMARTCRSTPSAGPSGRG